MIVLESFVMVGGREDRALAGHESQHPGPPGRGKTDKSCDWWIFQASSQSHHTHLMAPTQPTFLAQCVLWQAGGLTQRESREYIENYKFQAGWWWGWWPVPGSGHKHSPPSASRGRGQNSKWVLQQRPGFIDTFGCLSQFHKRWWPTHRFREKTEIEQAGRESSLKIWAGTINIETSGKFELN